MKTLKNILKFSWQALCNVINHDGIEHAGYLSFLVLFSIFPFVIFFLTLTSLFGFAEYGAEFINQITVGIPGDFVQKRTQELLNLPPASLMSLAIVGSIWTASSFVEGLRTILNRIYNLAAPPSYLFRRMLSILQFFIISMFLFCGMMLLVIIPIIVNKFSNINSMFDHLRIFGNVGVLLGLVRYILIFICLFFSSSTLYYIIPNVKIRYIDILPGAFLTVCLWLISGYFLSNYIKYYSQLNLIYGSIGNIIITMIFFYVVNIIFIYGAEFNYQIKKKNTR
jgi:membrane protein